MFFKDCTESVSFPQDRQVALRIHFGLEGKLRGKHLVQACQHQARIEPVAFHMRVKRSTNVPLCSYTTVLPHLGKQRNKNMPKYSHAKIRFNDRIAIKVGVEDKTKPKEILPNKS